MRHRMPESAPRRRELHRHEREQMRTSAHPRIDTVVRSVGGVSGWVGAEQDCGLLYRSADLSVLNGLRAGVCERSARAPSD